MIIHVVKSGESLYSISRLYGVTTSKIAADNELTNPNILVIGQTLVIMQESRKHTVRSGQSLYIIAGMYGVSVSSILSANPQITNPETIIPGQVIIIPPRSNKLGTIEVNGYVYASAKMKIIQKTLPYLTYISIFSYDVKNDGTLSTIDDTPIIEAARNANVAPLMVITNIDQTGNFSGDLARSIINSSAVQDLLINNIIDILKSKNYYGVDIDFEYVFPDDITGYNNFLRKIIQRIRDAGFIVSTAVPPKPRATAGGPLLGAYNYPIIGALVDFVTLMTYEYGYAFGPPMAVAPIIPVKEVLSYAVTAIPRKKIMLGIPNYGYNWIIPYVPGSRASVVSNVGAVDLAAQVGAIIQYDVASQTPFFNYYDQSGKRHVVWFEDARSIQAKLNLVNQFGLRGVSYWTISPYFPQNWLVLSGMYNIKKVI